MKKFAKVVFYNGFHNGDLHVSREFVRQITKKINNQFPVFYAHNFDFEAIKDIGVTQTGLKNLHDINIKGGDFVMGGALFINTWYGSSKMKYMATNGTSFGCLYALFDDVCQRRFGFSMKDLQADPTKLYPRIDFSFYHTKDIDVWLTARPNRKKILVSNGKVLSGQAGNWPFYPIIRDLAAKYSRTDFILTNAPLKDKFYPTKNLHLSRSIIKKPGHDLNENAYLGTKCDAIIGKWSGAQTFSISQHNMFDRDCFFLCFLKRNHKAFRHTWISDEWKNIIKYRAEVICSERFKRKDIYDDIETLCKGALK